MRYKWLHHLTENVPPVASIGTHLFRPTALFHRVSPSLADENVWTLDFVDGRKFRLALGNDFLLLASDAQD